MSIYIIKNIYYLTVFVVAISMIYNLSRFLIKSTRPNIILITVDSLRQDHLGCYGYAQNISPNIDKLARTGAIFSQAISQSSWTWPSVHSIITSQYPSSHGVYFWDQYLSGSTSNFVQLLKDKGCATYFISRHGGLTRLNQGFTAFEDVSENKSSNITDKAELLIGENKNKQFFLWLHYMETHSNSYCDLPTEKRSAEDLTAKAIEDCSIRYDLGISNVDRQLGILLAKLKDLGIYKNTIIILAADHGEEMGEHGYYYTHGGALWDSTLRVPLIFSYPALFKKDKIIKQQVELIDIAPTILAILKIKPPEGIEGKSLIPLISKHVEGDREYTFSEVKENMDDLAGSPYNSATEWNYTKFSIRGDNYKLIVTLDKYGRQYELYDLEKDPQELINIAETKQEQLQIMKVKLEKWINRPKPKSASSMKPLDEKIKKKLKSLGYLQ
ncbi:MAG: sulfatase [Candidatus Omnitrophota bacterium]